jgi:hypothetical protein
LTGLALAAVNAGAQGARVVDLGGGIYQAAGVSGGTTVRVPQSDTFLVVTSGGNVSTMFGPPSQAYAEIVRLAGGPDAVAARAREITGKDPLGALYLTDMALAVDGGHRLSLEARIEALKALDARSSNSNERGWLAAGIREAEAKLRR